MDSIGSEAVAMNHLRHIDKSGVQSDLYHCADSDSLQRKEVGAAGAGIYPISSCTRMFYYHKSCVRFSARFRFVLRRRLHAKQLPLGNTEE